MSEFFWWSDINELILDDIAKKFLSCDKSKTASNYVNISLKYAYSSSITGILRILIILGICFIIVEL